MKTERVIDGGANEYISGVCPYCGFTTEQSSKHEELLIHHISTEHPNERIPTNNPSSQTTQKKVAAAFAYRCVFCGSGYPMAELLTIHYKVEHYDDVVGNQGLGDFPVKRPFKIEYSCPLCTYRGESESVVEGHMTAEHWQFPETTMDRTIECSECKLMFALDQQIPGQPMLRGMPCSTCKEFVPLNYKRDHECYKTQIVCIVVSLLR
jgi:hypothetical protein